MSSSVSRMPGRPNMVLGSDYGPDVDPSRWVVIYPPYIDSTRTEKQVCYFDVLLKSWLGRGAAQDFFEN